jgi:hypothetical protein
VVLNEDNNSLINKGFQKFLEKLDKNAEINFIKKTVTLYRAIGLMRIEDLKIPLGKYWAFDYEKAKVIDDEGYKHSTDKGSHEQFKFKAVYSFDDINWKESFNKYLMNDFMESEIEIQEESLPLELEFLNNDIWEEIKVEKPLQTIIKQYEDSLVKDTSLEEARELVEKDNTPTPKLQKQR